jgi:hypothetical protein
VSPEAKLPTRTRAVRMLTEQRAQIDDLLDRLGPRERTRPGLGGGDWSPKDLVSHLELWERFALDSVAAWERGERSRIDRELWSRSTSAINADGVAAAAHLSWPQATRRAGATHAELLALIDAISDARWRTPATPRARKPLGMRIGQFLAGSTGPFTHDLAHVKDLRAFVAARSAGD